MDNPCSVQMSFFFSTNCASFLLKIGKVLILMIRRDKKLELMKIVFITDLSIFGSKVLLILKIMDFESVVLTKVVHIYIYAIEVMNA